MKVIDDELAKIDAIFGTETLNTLRKVPIWVEWDHTIPRSTRTFAAYYGVTGDGLIGEGVDPRKSGCVCVLSLKVALAIRKRGGQQNTLLHELAHLVHDQVWGKDNTFINNAYQQAMARRLYDKVRHDDGTLGPAYAARNRFEYFAELTCAYLDKLDYGPHDRDELKDHDSVGYEIMTKAWGTPEQLEAARKKRDKEKKK